MDTDLADKEYPRVEFNLYNIYNICRKRLAFQYFTLHSKECPVTGHQPAALEIRDIKQT
jgi:hypothetical protein